MTDDAISFSRRLAELRSQANLSQRALARAVYVDHSLINRLESGLRKPDPELARRIGALLGAVDELHDLAVTEQREARRATPAGRPVAEQPNTLPPDTIHFTGREPELERLAAFLAADLDQAGAAGVFVITGIAGIGKTALALRAAHLTEARYPDGCLYADLQGYTPGCAPVTPGDALAALLTGLGLPEEAIPRSLAGRASRFLRESAARRMLIVLDNALTTGQVRSLLPSAAGSRVLITSRGRLVALDEANRLHLEHLSSRDGADLFGRVSGQHGVPDDIVGQVMSACRGNPLAIRIAAARCRADGPRSVSALARELAGKDSDRPDIADDERSVFGAFDVSYAHLRPENQRTFTLLGVHPPFPFRAHDVAALLDTSVTGAAQRLEALYAAGLLEAAGVDRYRRHDLLVRYATRAAAMHLPAPDRHAAIGRLLAHYLTTCRAADTVIAPYRYRLPTARPTGPSGPPDQQPPVTFVSYPQAHAWLSENLATLSMLCATAGPEGYEQNCWEIAHSLRGFLHLGRHFVQWRETHEAALAAAQRSGNGTAQAITLTNLGLMYSEQHLGQPAQDRLAEAIELYRSMGDRHGEFTARAHRAWLLFRAGHVEQALQEQRAALNFYQADGSSARSVAIVMRDLASMEAEAGQTRPALRHLAEAVPVLRALGMTLDLAMAANAAGAMALRTGEYPLAERHHLDALDLAGQARSDYEQARARAGLGRIAALGGRFSPARGQFAQALALYEAIGAVEAEAVRRELQALPSGE